MMSKENTRSFGGSLFGSLYQKFEAVCQEVDDIVNHEHRRVLENSVQSVGGNVMKFCSNVKDLIPLNNRTPLRGVEQSGKSNPELKGECSSVSDVKQFPQQIDLNYIDYPSSSSPDAIKQDCGYLSEELKQLSEISDPRFNDNFCIDQNFHSFSEEKQPINDETELINLNTGAPSKDVEDANVEQLIDLNFIDNPSSSSSELLQVQKSEIFSNQDCGFLNEKLKQLSETSDPRFSDNFVIDQNFHPSCEEKQPVSETEFITLHSSSKEKRPVSDETEFITLHFGAPLKEVEQSVKSNSELEDGDGDDEGSFAIDLNFIDSSSSSATRLFQLRQSDSFSVNQDCGFLSEESLSDTAQPTFHEEDFSSAASIHSSGSEFHKKEEPLHENSLIFEDYVKKEIISDINKLSQESELVVVEENSPSLMTTTVTYPLLHFSDHTETESQCAEWGDKDTEIGSISSFAPASQTSEPYTCLISPKDNTGTSSSSFFPFTSQEFTEVPINSPRDSEGLKLNLPGKSKLDESGVFVLNDGNHIDLFSVERNWTYKKKIRNPFTSRRKLEKEYKRLSLYYCDIDAEFNEVAGEKLVPLSHNDKHIQPSTQDLQDSEWEFV